MKIAIPLAEGKLTMHFGHCKSFCIAEADEKGNILKSEEILAPPHEPGLLPKWLGQDLKVNLIIAGGMGQRAQTLFTDNGVKVVVGAPSESPEILIKHYFEGTLQTGSNACDH